MSTLPKWPEPDAVGRVSNRELYKAAMARPRMAVEALQKVTYFEQDSNTPDTFDCAAEALRLIGPLPAAPVRTP